MTSTAAGPAAAAHVSAEMPSSPVQEQENLHYPAKAKQLTDLNTEIAKINLRRDSGELSLERTAEPVARKEIVEKTSSSTNAVKQLEVPLKERKVSRFRISVVKEPDDSKLVVPDRHEVKVAAPEPIAETSAGGHEEPSSVVKPEVRAAINDTYEILENIIIKSYGVQGKII